jgi:hypothetical protein
LGIFAVARELTGKSVAVMWDAIAVSWDRIVIIRECAAVLWEASVRQRFRVALAHTLKSLAPFVSRHLMPRPGFGTTNVIPKAIGFS